MIGKTREALEHLARSRKRRTPEELGAAVGKALARWKAGKFFFWRVQDGKLEWSVDQERVETEQSLDGCYVVRTDVPERVFDKNAAVAAYRQLAEVDRGFRQLKTVGLEIRPTYHHKDERIEAHVFLCVLAYYVQWHMRQRLTPLFAEDGEGKDRRWTFAGVLERLKGIRQETVVFRDTAATLATQGAKIANPAKGTEVTLRTTPDDEQQRILDLLGVRL